MRKRFVLACICLSILLACEAPKQQEPNFIFIMADDLGYGDLGSYGQKIIQTPELDQLAAEGMHFTQFYAGSPVCAPSRSVLMTGQHTGHTRVRGNFGVGGVKGLGGGEGRVPLKAEDKTIATYFQEAGYKTGMIGKWGLGEPKTSGEPGKKGFEEFFGFLNQRRAHNYYSPYLWQNEEKYLIEENQDGKKEIYAHDLFTEKALDFLDRNRDRSFFLYLPYTLPHDKYEIPDLGIYQDSLHWGKDAQVHAAMVGRLDADIGRIMRRLRKHGLDKNTWVFFCSDNGAARRWEGIFDSSGKLRGRKRDLYEGGIRSPLIVWQPNFVPAGTKNELPLHFMDILPSLCSIAKIPINSPVDGLDRSSGFQNPAWRDERDEDRVLYWEFYERGFQQAIRYKDLKGIKLSPEAEWELYNLSDDPGEKLNLASEERKESIELMENLARKHHRPSPHYPKEEK